jgi:hypothetical protein
MREQQAREMIARIERDYPGRIQATMDTRQVTKAGNGYRVALLLVAGQRQMLVNRVRQLDDVLDVWQPFLQESEE